MTNSSFTVVAKGIFKYTERKKKCRVNFIPKFHSSLKKFVKYFTMITKRYMYGTKVPNFIGFWSTSLELLKFIGSYPTNLEIKIKLKINIGCAPPPPGGFRRFLTLLSSSSHMCSVGVKSGLYGGHASGAMLLFARKSWQAVATCGRALSCCRIRLRCCTSGTATGRKISSLYLTVVILPATIISCNFIPWAMPPQTIMEPSPNQSRSTTQASAKCSPRRQYTRRRPSAR